MIKRFILASTEYNVVSKDLVIFVYLMKIFRENMIDYILYISFNCVLSIFVCAKESSDTFAYASRYIPCIYLIYFTLIYVFGMYAISIPNTKMTFGKHINIDIP